MKLPLWKGKALKLFLLYSSTWQDFCRDSPKFSLCQEGKCTQEWEGTDTWSDSKETCLKEPAFPSGPSLLPERTSFLDSACLLSFLPNTLPKPGNLDFLFKERCLERKIDYEQPIGNRAELADSVLSDSSHGEALFLSWRFVSCYVLLYSLFVYFPLVYISYCYLP